MPIKWRQFRDLEKQMLPDNLDEGEEWVPFVPAFRMNEPAVDIYQDKNNLYVEIPLSGAKPENINISIEENILTIQGKSEEKKQIKEKDYFRKETRSGAFQRSVRLPLTVKANQAKAEVENGVLKITIPKAGKSASQTKRIPIKIKK